MLGYLFRGILIGLVFGVPAGAIGALTIKRTMDHGFLAGIMTGAGSSVADVFYSCVGICGITIISDFLTRYQAGINIIGGVLIMLLGYFTIRKKRTKNLQDDSKSNPILCFISSLGVAIINPTTVLSFMIAFTAFGISGKQTITQAIGLILGILIGTMCWWALLSGIVALFRNKISDGIYKWLNGILGCLMILLGIIMVFRGTGK